MRFNSSIYIVSLFLIVLPSLGEAGLFGPNDYDSCIIESMKGVTSDVAANSIRNSCRQKFPRKLPDIRELPESALLKIEGHSNSIHEEYICTIFNGNSDWVIASLLVRITDNTKNTFKDYIADKPLETSNINGKELPFTLAPLKQGEFRFKPFQLPSNHSWAILKAYGFKVND
jgi:hypothetical protein